MTWLAAHWPFLLLLVLYSTMLVRHALEGRRRTHGRADYYVGGRSMGGLVLGLSFFATYSSTNSFVGFSGQSYTYGAPWLLLAPGIVLFSLASWVWVAPRLRAFTGAVDSVTLPDYIGFRFDSEAARVLAALIVIFASFLYMTAVFKGIGNLLEIFLHIPYSAAIVFVLLAVMAYTAVGGFISVVKTDAVQGVLMVLAAILLFGATVRAAGGLGALDQVRGGIDTGHLFTWDAAMPFPVLIGIIVAGTMKTVVEPRQLSRFYGLADRGALRRGMWASTLAFLIAYVLLVPIGLYAHLILGGAVAESDLVVPTLLGQAGIVPPLVGAFLVIAMLAAAMSSLDSVLLVMASTWERDVVSLLRPEGSEAAAVRATRFYVALFALVTALIALRPPGSIVTLTAFSGSLYAACFFPAVVLGLYWRKGNGAAVTASFAVGILTLLLWKELPVGGLIHEVFPAIAFSTLAYVTLAALGPPSPLASRAGQDPRS
jgi:SSS family transporter